MKDNLHIPQTVVMRHVGLTIREHFGNICYNLCIPVDDNSLIFTRTQRGYARINMREAPKRILSKSEKWHSVRKVDCPEMSSSQISFLGVTDVCRNSLKIRISKTEANATLFQISVH